jgi:hypothetical protein
MSEGNVKKYTHSKGYESISRDMLQDVDHLSLEAIGLLAHLSSFRDTWKIFKTELYKRFTKSKRTKIEKAWNELVEEKYIVQLRKRVGKRYEYIYYHSQVKFSDEDIEEISQVEDAEIWDGKVKNDQNDGSEHRTAKKSSQSNDSSTVDFQQSKMNSSKSTHKKLSINEINYKDNHLDTEDTSNLSPDHTFSNSLPDEQILKEKERYMQNAFIENQEYIPKELATMLSSSIEQAKEYYNLILLAKKNTERTYESVIWLEQEPELLHEIINTFSRAVRKIEKERIVDNPNGYIYKSIHGVLSREFAERARMQVMNNREPPGKIPFYNWVDKN